MKSSDLLAKRAALIREARHLVDAAPNDVLSAEDDEQFTRLMAEAEALKEQADRIGNLESMESAVEEPRAAKREQPAEQTDEQPKRNVLDTPEYRKAFWNHMRYGTLSPILRAGFIKGDAEDRALGIVTTAGGYTVPTDTFRQLIDTSLYNVNVMRQLATVITAGANTEVATNSAHGAAAWTAESVAYNESDEAFNQVTFAAYKATRIIKVNEELLQDSVFDIEALVRDQFALSIGALEEAAFVNGNGSAKPTGVVGGSTAGTTAASGTVVTADEVIALYHAVPRPYRPGASWLFADATALKLRKLKGGDGQYLWQPGLQAGAPDMLIGKPVFISDNMPAMTSGNKAMLFGDFKRYWIVDRADMVFKRLNELYAASGQVGFLCSMRTDGKLTDASAVYHQLMA